MLFRKTHWKNFSSYHSVHHCPALDSPVNGELSCTLSFSYGSKCSFSCVEGFLLQGASEISCTKTAEWSHEPPHCEGNKQTPVSFMDLHTVEKDMLNKSWQHFFFTLLELFYLQ